MKRLTLCAALALMLSAGITAAQDPLPRAQPADVGMTESGLANLAASMQGLVDDGRRAGVVWGVVKDGRLVQLEAHGQRNVEADLPMETDTVFRIYSQSRAVTGAAILTLVDDGSMALDDPVANYLPEIADMQVIAELRRDQVVRTVPQDPPMTIRHLYNYTAGLGYARSWPAGVGIEQREILSLDQTLEDMIDLLSTYPLLAQPGEKWIYGYHSDVLGALAERVSGRDLNDFLARRLFGPLGMDDTGFWVRRGSNDRLAVVYGPDDSGALQPRSALPSSTYTEPGKFFSAGGGLVSTVPDYLRFGQMILNGGELDGERILKAGTVAEMGTNALGPEQGTVSFADGFVPPKPFAGYAWGLAIGVRLAHGVHTVPGSPGDLVWGGLANTTYFLDPVENIVAVAMTQYLGPDADELVFRLREGVYGAIAERRGGDAPTSAVIAAPESSAGTTSASDERPPKRESETEGDLTMFSMTHGEIGYVDVDSVLQDRNPYSVLALLKEHQELTGADESLEIEIVSAGENEVWGHEATFEQLIGEQPTGKIGKVFFSSSGAVARMTGGILNTQALSPATMVVLSAEAEAIAREAAVDYAKTLPVLPEWRGKIPWDYEAYPAKLVYELDAENKLVRLWRVGVSIYGPVEGGAARIWISPETGEVVDVTSGVSYASSNGPTFRVCKGDARVTGPRACGACRMQHGGQ